MEDKFKFFFDGEIKSSMAFNLLLYAALFVIAGFIINFLSLAIASDATMGTFGDFLGGVLNPILTFLSFVGILWTILIQKKEISLSREEIKENREILKEQSENIRLQRFENTFFSLIGQFQNMLLSEDETLIEIHRLCFRVQFLPLSDAQKILELNNHKVGHIFRLLYQIYKLIWTHFHPDTEINNTYISRTNTITAEEKLYSSIVRSIINNEVMQMVAINCATSNKDYVGFKRLLENYQQFEHLSFIYDGRFILDSLLESSEYFRVEAFGNNDLNKQELTDIPLRFKKQPNLIIKNTMMKIKRHTQTN